jgi:hypothetical protein
MMEKALRFFDAALSMRTMTCCRAAAIAELKMQSSHLTVRHRAMDAVPEHRVAVRPSVPNIGAYEAQTDATFARGFD